jgi:hypothetical protein
VNVCAEIDLLISVSPLKKGYFCQNSPEVDLDDKGLFFSRLISNPQLHLSAGMPSSYAGKMCVPFRSTEDGSNLGAN